MSLTEDDRNWILAQLAETNARIERVETSFSANLATRGQLERVETALLTEFHKWAAQSSSA